MIKLHFGNDVYSENRIEDVPETNGIYVAYSGKYDGTSNVVLNKILYIGKADKCSFKERISDHINNDHNSWQEHCNNGETIYYMVAELDDEIANVEAVLILMNKPVCNTQGKEKYIGTYPPPFVDTDWPTKLKVLKGPLSFLLCNGDL